MKRAFFIHSRPQNRTLKGADGAWPFSISLRETAGFSPRSFISNYGCYARKADAALIISYLKRNGWEVISNIKKADLIIINTCAVIKDNEDVAVVIIKEAIRKKRSKAEMFIAGCLPSINQARLNRIFKGITVSADFLDMLDSLLVPRYKIREIECVGNGKYFFENAREYLLMICGGCIVECRYCTVKNVFGFPHSRPLSKLIQEFNCAYN